MDRNHIHLSRFTHRERDGRSQSNRTRHMLRLVRAALLALLMATFASVPSASAAVPGLLLKSVTSLDTSNSTKSQVARCPSGTKLIGAAGHITGATGKVVLTAITPLTDLSGVSVSAGQVTKEPVLDWSVTAHAICANASALAGLQLVSAESPGFANSSSPKTATATCPSGKTLLGTGGSATPAIRDGRAGVALEDIRPNTSLTSVTVTAAETFSGTSENWRAQAFAICASSVTGAQVVSVPSATNSISPKSTVARCPSGMKVIGTGGSIGALPTPGRAVIDEIRPLADLSGVVVVAAEAEIGTTDNWNMAAQAICAAP